MMNKLSITDLPIEGKSVLVRVDFNVPLDANGNITDDTRIRKTLPTIEYLLSRNARVILISHLGRPKGKRSDKDSLLPCSERLGQLLPVPVHFASECIGPKAATAAAKLREKEVLLLENLRFHSAEEKPEKDPTFAKQLASLADIYVNDAFGAAHRKHSSTSVITNFFPQKSAMGLLMKEEVNFLSSLISNSKHPFYALVGGAKVSSKMGVLSSLLTKVDALFIGGGMAYTFLRSQGVAIGNSLFEPDLLETAAAFLEKAKEKNIPVWLPKDLVIANRFDNDAEKKTVTIEEGIPDGWEGMDIGEQTITEWMQPLQKCATLFWNGPVGVFEFPNFAHGTHTIAKALAKLNAITIVGGGDSIAAINQLDLSSNFSHISTGGGASLEFLEYGHLPGIDALSDK